jgi:hypothetical protein
MSQSFDAPVMNSGHALVGVPFNMQWDSGLETIRTPLHLPVGVIVKAHEDDSDSPFDDDDISSARFDEIDIPAGMGERVVKRKERPSPAGLIAEPSTDPDILATELPECIRLDPTERGAITHGRTVSGLQVSSAGTRRAA